MWSMITGSQQLRWTTCKNIVKISQREQKRGFVEEAAPFGAGGGIEVGMVDAKPLEPYQTEHEDHDFRVDDQNGTVVDAGD